MSSKNNIPGQEFSTLEVAPTPGLEISSEDLPETVQQQHGSELEPSQKRKKKCRPPRIFWILLALFVVCLVVGLVGGIIGSRSTQHKSASKGYISPYPWKDEAYVTVNREFTSSIVSSTPTSTPAIASSKTATSTSSTPASSGTTGIAANSCTSITPLTYKSPSGQSFLEFCFTDFPNGDNSYDGNGTVSDIGRTITYTFEDCMNACVTWNEGNSGLQCAAVTYNANLTSAVAGTGGNCFFKNKRGVSITSEALVASAAVAD